MRFLSKTTKLNLLVSLHEEASIDLIFIYYLLLFFLSLSPPPSLSLSLSLSFSLPLSLFLSLSISLLWIIGNLCVISQNYLSLFLFLSRKVPLLLHLMQIYGIFVLVFFVFPKHKATHSYFLVYFLGDREK